MILSALRLSEVFVRIHAVHSVQNQHRGSSSTEDGGFKGKNAIFPDLLEAARFKSCRTKLLARCHTPSVSCSINHTIPLFLARKLSRPKMEKPRTSQPSNGRTARARQKPRRSERIGSSEALQIFALQEASLSVQAPKQGVDISPLATSERQAGSFPSSDCHTYSSRKRSNAEGPPGMELSSDIQQRDKRAAMGSHSLSASIALSTQSHRCSERPFVLIPWHEPSPKAYRRIYDNLDEPNPAQQPNSYQPYDQLEYEAQSFLRNITYPRLGPLYSYAPVDTSAIGDAPSIGSAGLSYTGTGHNGHSLFKHQDPRRRAAKIKPSAKRQTPSRYGHPAKERHALSSVGISKDVIRNHTLDLRHTILPEEPSKNCLIQEANGPEPRPAGFANFEPELIDDHMVCNRDRTKKSSAHLFLVYFWTLYVCRLAYTSSLFTACIQKLFGKNA